MPFPGYKPPLDLLSGAKTNLPDSLKPNNTSTSCLQYVFRGYRSLCRSCRAKPFHSLAANKQDTERIRCKSTDFSQTIHVSASKRHIHRPLFISLPENGEHGHAVLAPESRRTGHPSSSPMQEPLRTPQKYDMKMPNHGITTDKDIAPDLGKEWPWRRSIPQRISTRNQSWRAFPRFSPRRKA